MTSYVTVAISIPLTHDQPLPQAELEEEGFRITARVLAAVAGQCLNGLTSPGFPATCDADGLKAVLSQVSAGV